MLPIFQCFSNTIIHICTAQFEEIFIFYNVIVYFKFMDKKMYYLNRVPVLLFSNIQTQMIVLGFFRKLYLFFHAIARSLRLKLRFNSRKFFTFLHEGRPILSKDNQFNCGICLQIHLKDTA